MYSSWVGLAFDTTEFMVVWVCGQQEFVSFKM
jgi:hypothetical protein